MKRVLIICPYFPPSNAADMQRIRMSLPYFEENGWEAEVVMVHEKYSETIKDPLLLKSIPSNILIHKVEAFSKKWTGKFGLGSLAMRSMYFYHQYVNRLLRSKKYDIIYFSTTEFLVTVLGSYWKKKFKVPYVIDMQDPWHSDYYKNKPKAERPKKYWFSYRLNKYAEPMAMKDVDGLISVSKIYIDKLKDRYPVIKNIPAATITFGAFKKDVEIASLNHPNAEPIFTPSQDYVNIVYIGRAGYDMQKAISLLFESMKNGLAKENEIFSKLKLYFIGTSYAPKGTGTPTVLPLAKTYAIENQVIEQTDRIGFYESLNYLQKADALFIPGSDDPQYTASKIYPYILAERPLLAIFNPLSSAATVIKSCNAGAVASLQSDAASESIIYHFLKQTALRIHPKNQTNWAEFEQYTASTMTKKQCILFDEVTEKANNGI